MQKIMEDLKLKKKKQNVSALRNSTVYNIRAFV